MRNSGFVFVIENDFDASVRNLHIDLEFCDEVNPFWRTQGVSSSQVDRNLEVSCRRGSLRLEL